MPSTDSDGSEVLTHGPTSAIIYSAREITYDVAGFINLHKLISLKLQSLGLE
jgi:hypothetical protein